jgi:hypothetical protein
VKIVRQPYSKKNIVVKLLGFGTGSKVVAVQGLAEQRTVKTAVLLAG